MDAFEIHDHYALATTVEIAGQTRQITILGRQSPEKIIVAPARPKATRVQHNDDSKKTATKKTATKKPTTKKGGRGAS